MDAFENRAWLSLNFFFIHHITSNQTVSAVILQFGKVNKKKLIQTSGMTALFKVNQHA